MKTTGQVNTLKLTVCAAALLLASAVAQAAGIAFVTNVKGEALADGIKLGLMAELNRGQRIACVAECNVGVMYLQSGKEYLVKGPGEYLIGDNEVTAKIGLPPSMRDTAWRVSSQTVTQLAGSSSASVRMRGIKGLEQPAPERLIYPVQTKIASLSPSFRWDISNAKGPYEFELLAPGADKPIYRTKTTAGTLKLPASVKLLPDTTYTWSIGADGHALGTGSFTSLSSAALDMVKLRKPADTADFSDRLMYGVMLHDLGATQDAQEIWLKLAAERADRPELSSWSK